MKRARLVLLLGIALVSTACAEDEPARISFHFADEVQLADREPGGACLAVDALEVRSGPNDLSSAETLRALAHHRGANYVVIDTFSVCDESPEPEVRTRARLFRCPLGASLR